MLRAGARHPPDAAMASTSNPQDHAEEDMMQIYATLNEYLQLEHKYQPSLCLPAESENGEVTIGARDGAAHVLRCLKMWFDLPSEVLLNAINLFDRFLTKMKVRPCHVPCITVSCMNIAVDEFASQNKCERAITAQDLVTISQSACTAGDVSRMSRIITDKLGLSGGLPRADALHWVRLFRTLVRAVAKQLQLLIDPLPEESELMNLLEIAFCDATCANSRPSEIALVLIYHKLELELVEWSKQATVPEDAYRLFELAAQVQEYCHMADASLSLVRAVLARYEARSAAGAPQRQRLVWRLSERTLKVLRPTDRLTSLLPTIEETPANTRSDSESSMTSEMSDWPRSPVLPVYCDN